jgi:hypothetical protein
MKMPLAHSRPGSDDPDPLPSLAAFAEPFLEAQRSQWNAWVRFQESLATMYMDLWDQWAVRFAGGAPIEP